MAAPADLPQLRPRPLRDDSPNRHAAAHHQATSHPIMRSLDPGEDWNWCYVDEVAFRLDGITGTTRIPPSPLLS
jgi:hypothetical protein